MDNVILGYKRGFGESDPYWLQEVIGTDGKPFDRKYIRVIAGVSLPILDRVSGAVIVLGEMYMPSGPQDFWGLNAACGPWPVVENALTSFRKDLLFDHVIADIAEARQLLWRMPGIHFALNEVPQTTYVAPDYSCTEVGRSKTEQMIAEGRLHLDDVKSILDQEPDQGFRALCSVVCWMLECKAWYVRAKLQPRRNGRWLGLEGL